MITAIFSAIAALPKLLEYLKSFISWISERIAVAEKQKLEAEMKKAIEQAEKSKDTSGLDQLFDPRKKK